MGIIVSLVDQLMVDVKAAVVLLPLYVLWHHLFTFSRVLLVLGLRPIETLAHHVVLLNGLEVLLQEQIELICRIHFIHLLRRRHALQIKRLSWLERQELPLILGVLPP